MQIPLPQPRRYLVIGVNSALIDFVETLLAQAVPAEAITVVVDGRRPPSDIDRISDVSLIELPAADEKRLADLLSGAEPTIGCVFSWYAVFSRDFVESFPGPLFNLHLGELPRYRGAGGYSWQVLNNERTLGAYVHLLTPRVDAGPIVCSEVAEVEEPTPYPSDYIRLSKVVARNAAVRFAELLCNDDALAASVQDEAAAEYYPKLTTLRNGVIDFSWSVVHVDRFVRAFSDPYPGAMFSYRGATFRVTQSVIVQDSLTRHPFCSGLIVNISDAGLHVMLKDGVVAFQNIRDADGNPVAARAFTIGDRLYTEDAARLSASLFRPARD